MFKFVPFFMMRLNSLGPWEKNDLSVIVLSAIGSNYFVKMPVDIVAQLAISEWRWYTGTDIVLK